jgi:hypothetical protein
MASGHGRSAAFELDQQSTLGYVFTARLENRKDPIKPQPEHIMLMLAAMSTLAWLLTAGLLAAIAFDDVLRYRPSNHEEGDSGGGGGQRPHVPPPPGASRGPQEPTWWPEFERQLEIYKARALGGEDCDPACPPSARGQRLARPRPPGQKHVPRHPTARPVGLRWHQTTTSSERYVRGRVGR